MAIFGDHLITDLCRGPDKSGWFHIVAFGGLF